DLATTAGSAIAPLQHGDMASLGLTGWTPAGIIRWSFELINVTTHLPWFHTIVLGCAFWKLVTLPLNVIGLRNSMRMLPIQAEVQKIQGVVAEARKTGDIALMQKQSAVMKELYAKAGVSGFGMMAPLLQLPVTLGLFFGVRKMCELPLAQLAWSGFEYLPNLTEPSWAIAAIFTAAVNLQIHIGKYELNLRDRPSSGHLMNLIHAMSTMGFFVAGFWPSGLVLALTTTSLFTSIQSLLLRVPAVRRLFAIPSLTKEERGRPP
ncbi:60Kd inner membrane protein-domain-containing protein, partial [Crucibulum laeve]